MVFANSVTCWLLRTKINFYFEQQWPWLHDIINFEQQPLPPYFGDLGDDHLHNYASIDNRDIQEFLMP